MEVLKPITVDGPAGDTRFHFPGGLAGCDDLTLRTQGDAEIIVTPVYAWAIHNAAQTCVNAAWDSIAFNTTLASKKVTIAGGKFTAQLPGYYGLTASVSFAASAAGTVRQISFFINGSYYAAINSRSPSTTGGTNVSLAWQHPFAPGDYVEVQAYQDSGANLNIINANYYTPVFAMVKIGDYP